MVVNPIPIANVERVFHPDLHARLCRARTALRDTEADPRSVATVAREIRFSPFHFIRLYKTVFGATPHQHQSEARIDRAKELLLLTERSVTDVCMEVGFSSLGSFSSLFKKRVGESPTAFQRRHRRDGRPRATMPPELVPGCLTLVSPDGHADVEIVLEPNANPVAKTSGEGD